MYLRYVIQKIYIEKLWGHIQISVKKKLECVKIIEVVKCSESIKKDWSREGQEECVEMMVLARCPEI